MSRRPLLIGFSAVVFSAVAGTQAYPAKPITPIVPHPAGGTSDILARTVAAEVSKLLKHRGKAVKASGATAD